MAITTVPTLTTTVNPMTEWTLLKDKATTLVKSGFLPKGIDTPEKAIAIILAGKEFGLPDMQSIRHLFVLDGKVSTSAEIMLALIYRSGKAETLHITPTNTGCRITTNRYGQPVHDISFTEEDAKAAGLVGKDNWRKYPRAMYRSRCVSEMSRTVYPDVVCGLYTPDELELPTMVTAEQEVVLDHTKIVPQGGVSLFDDQPMYDEVVPPAPPEPHNFKFLKVMAGMKKTMGEANYYEVLKQHGYDHANQITNRDQQVAVYNSLLTVSTEIQASDAYEDERTVPEDDEPLSFAGDTQETLL